MKILDSALVGALLGAFLGIVFLLVGATRILLAALNDVPLQSPTLADIALASAYCGSFVVAGAIGGVVRGYWPQKAGTYGGFIIAGIIASFIVATLFGDETSLGFTLLFATVNGSILGAACAYGWLSSAGHTDRADTV